MHSPLGGDPATFDPVTNSSPKTPFAFFTFANKLEMGHGWTDIWIPFGMFNDLMDVTNSDPTENDWDNISGYTIKEMYNGSIYCIRHILNT